MKNNKQVVTAAVSQDGCVLGYASNEMKSNVQVVTIAVTSCDYGKTSKYASDR